MSIFKNIPKEEMIEKKITEHLCNLFQKIKVAHLIISPEDWTYMRKVPVSPSNDRELFEKGHCGKIWGANIWVLKEATEIKAYAETDLDKLEKDYPELAKVIKESSV